MLAEFVLTRNASVGVMDSISKTKDASSRLTFLTQLPRVQGSLGSAHHTLLKSRRWRESVLMRVATLGAETARSLEMIATDRFHGLKGYPSRGIQNSTHFPRTSDFE